MPDKKDLKDKAIDIKGKQYVLVSDRVKYFNETYPNGAIMTKLLSTPDAKMIVVQAIIRPNVKNIERAFTGLAQEVIGEGMVNKTSAMENADTSAVGRALGMMGIGVIESIASADEMNKANNREEPSIDIDDVAPPPPPFKGETYEEVEKEQAGDVRRERKVGDVCHDCGKGVYKMSKAGKPYCSLLCWQNK